MKFNFLILTFACVICLSSCSEQKTHEIPVRAKIGYGPFSKSFAGLSFYDFDDEHNPWRAMYLNPTGIPDDWTGIEIGDIDINIYQAVYYNYHEGLIEKEFYEEMLRAWNWSPDSTELSKEPLRSKVAYVYGKDASGEMKIIVDANNNLDFSDDESFSPYAVASFADIDSLVIEENSVIVSYDVLLNNKVVEVKVPLLICFYERVEKLVANFPQHLEANYKGETILITSGGFTDLSYESTNITLVDDSMNEENKIKEDDVILKNEFIEIQGSLYKNLGVNLNKNSLILEEVDVSDDLYSTQVGFKSFLFEDTDITTGENISLEALQGKYVFLDFWAVWCGPCLSEIPAMKELYAQTDREKFEIVGIVGDSPLQSVKDLIENDSISWPQIVSDSNNQIKETYGIKGYPTTFLINPEGKIIAKDLRGQMMVDHILELLAEE